MVSENVLELLAVGVLVAWCVAIALATRWEYAKTRYTRAQFPIWVVYLFYTRIVWRGEGHRRHPPPTGSGCDHRLEPRQVRSTPLFIQLTSDKVVRWMVAREYSLDPKLKWIFDILGSISVNRGGVDAAATKRALRLAQRGRKSRRVSRGAKSTRPTTLLLPGRPGVAMIALRAQVPRRALFCVRRAVRRHGVRLFRDASSGDGRDRPTDRHVSFLRPGT